MGWSQALKLVVVVVLASAGCWLVHHLPPRVQVERHWGSRGVNWFGQGLGAAYLYAAAILVLLCLLRYAIVRGACCSADAAVWYLLLLTSLVPAIWLLVVVDWDNEGVSPHRQPGWHAHRPADGADRLRLL